MAKDNEVVRPAPAPAQGMDPGAKNHIMNIGAVPLTVPIENPSTGDKDEVFLQPGGKPSLPAGYVVNAAYLARNSNVLRVATA